MQYMQIEPNLLNYFMDILFEPQRREESSLGSKQYVCANQVRHDIKMYHKTLSFVQTPFVMTL